MSRRTAEANKAVRLAWEREHDLVQEGKGTRDWTKEQQQDILDPDKGKAYDDKGRAFEGQHMKSVVEYPEYQGNPDNIQFLTKDEHLEAHRGSWQNPTNWYYNSMTKEFTEFGEDELVPCEILELSNPIIISEIMESKQTEKESAQKDRTEMDDNSDMLGKNENVSHSKRSQNKSAGKAIIPKPTVAKSGAGVIRVLKDVGKFIIKHPVESLEIAGVVVTGIAKVVSSKRGSGNMSNRIYNSDSSTSSATSVKPDIVTIVADVAEKTSRTLPRENDVSGHSQRYHTKDGIVWKDKAPYHRGGKKND